MELRGGHDEDSDGDEFVPEHPGGRRDQLYAADTELPSSAFHRPLLFPAPLSSSPAGGPSAKRIPRSTSPRYRECQKNHAASTGGHVLDGCGEFMPGEALKCDACGCHRSFHRKEFRDEGGPLFLPATATVAPSLPRYALQMTPYSSLVQLEQKERQAAAEVENKCMGGATTTESSSDEKRRKRQRTKFTADQKERMAEFAERVGWKMPKHDEGALERFCRDAGVSRQGFKVWMHNNKQLALSSSNKPSAPLIKTLHQQQEPSSPS